MSVRRHASGRVHYNYFRDYDPATGRYSQSDPIGLGGGINTYRYAYANPVEYLDPEGLSACKKLFCLPASIRKHVTSQDMGASDWRLDNVSVTPESPPNVGRLPEFENPLELFDPSQTALCFFGRTRSYRDTTTRYREWSCLEVCIGDCGLQYKEVRYSEFVDQTEKIRKKREQQVMQIQHLFPWHHCKELLRGLR